LVKCTGACLDPELGQLGLRLELAPLELPVPAPRDLAYNRVIYELRVINAMHEVQSNMMHEIGAI
jgi:hypothetical protein